MDIFSWNQREFLNNYNILCANLLNPDLSREGMHPTFCKIALNQKTLIHHHYEPEIFFIINVIINYRFCNIIVFPALGGETINPLWPKPMGIIRSIILIE